MEPLESLESQEAAGLLDAGLEEIGLALSPLQREQLLALGALVGSWAPRTNLTGHRSPEGVLQRLLLESLALWSRAEPVPSVADLGSGAGFPGLPLAIARPECRVLLVESRARRHHFQRAALRRLGLPNARALLGRAERIRAQPHHAVIAQAVARPDQALRWMAPWVEESGLLLLPLAPDSPPVSCPPGVRQVEIRRYRVPLGGPERALWVGRKADPPRG